MRRIALFGLILLLPACGRPGDYVGNPFDGFGGFLGDTISFNPNPNRPVVDSENMHRVAGQSPPTEPLLPSSGNIWPGPPQPEPTMLEDIEREQTQPVPPATGQTVPRPPRGSSTPPAGQPGTMPPLRAPSPPQSRAAPVAPAGLPNGAVVQTPQGPATINSGGAVPTFIMPNGSTGTVINNGNGTVTLINPDGTTQSVAAPR